MDIASLLGLLGALGFIIYAMVSGGGVGPFIDVPSLAIVFGGTFFFPWGAHILGQLRSLVAPTWSRSACL